MLELLTQMFFSFFKIGAFSIGGGYAMIPLIQNEMLSKGWMTLREITDLVAISQITPGPYAVNAATFAGTKVAGLAGAAVSTLGVVLPSILLTLVVSRFFFTFHKNKRIQAILYGVRPAVTGLILSAAAVIAGTAFFGLNNVQGVGAVWQSLGQINLPAIGIFLVAFIAMRKWKVSPVLLVFLSAAAGVMLHMAGL